MSANPHRATKIIDLGLIDYAKAWDYQTTLFNSVLEIKKQNRELTDQKQPTRNYLLFCEHPPVFTLGNSGEEKNLLIEKDALSKEGATFVKSNRGGDITFHGPGQLVVYPIIDLENFFTDIHKYMRSLEEAVILTLRQLSLAGGRLHGLTGVWIDPQKPKTARKICAMGVKTSRWVTMHGLALNVNTDLHFFDHIVPCGISDKAVTSIEKEIGRKQDMEHVKDLLKNNLMQVFEMESI